MSVNAEQSIKPAPEAAEQRPNRRARREARRKTRREMRGSITLAHLTHAIEEVLTEQGRSPVAYEDWEATAATQFRISDVDLHGSSSPERQLRWVAEWCVRFAARPIHVCFEDESGYPTKQERTVGHLREPGDKRPSRKAWWELYEMLRTRTLCPTYLVTFSPDRFTRNVSNGNEWLDTLFALGITLCQAKGARWPRPLTDREEKTYWRDAFQAAEDYSATVSEKINDEFDYKARAGEVLYGNPGFGHRGKKDAVKKNRRGDFAVTSFVAVPEEARVINIAKGLLLEGLRPHAVCVELNERGLLTRRRARWRPGPLERVMTNPRLIGKGRRGGVLYDANIEPLMSESEFTDVCAAFRPTGKRTRSAARSYALSNILVCGYCEEEMTGAYQKATDKRTYQCSTRYTTGLRACRCSPPQTCSCDRSPKHPSPDAQRVEDFVFEAALACYDVERALAETKSPPLRALSKSEQRRTTLNEDLNQMVVARKRVYDAHMDMEISDEEKTRRLAVLDAKRQAVNEELKSLDDYERRRKDGLSRESVRERMWSDAQFARDRVEGVIDHIVIERVPGCGHPEMGITIVWRDDLVATPPDAAVDALRDELIDRHRARSTVARYDAKPPVSPSVEQMLFEMWQIGETYAAMVARLTADGVTTPRGGRWQYDAIVRILKVACEHRGVAFENHRRRGGVAGPRYPAAIRNLVFELVRDESVTFDDVVEDLNRMGYTTYSGGPWDRRKVRQLYASECARRGTRPVGRKRGLPENVERLVEARHRAGESRNAIAAWLNTQPVRRASGKPWDGEAVTKISQRRKRAGVVPVPS